MRRGGEAYAHDSSSPVLDELKRLRNNQRSRGEGMNHLGQKGVRENESSEWVPWI